MSNKENRVGRGVVEVAVVGLEVCFEVVLGGGAMVESCQWLSCCIGL